MNNHDVLAVGNCIVDQVMHLESYPLEDKEQRAIENYRVMGGNACNSAQILAQQGHKVQLLSSFAADNDAKWLFQQLAAADISTKFCKKYPGYFTPVSSVWLSRSNGSRTIVHYRNLPELTLQDLNRVAPEDYRWIHFEGRNINTLRQYLPNLSSGMATVSLEIEKQRDQIEELLPYVDMVIVSSHYLRDKNISAEDCLNELKQLNSDMDIVCTLGSSGLIAMDSKGEIYKMGAEPVGKVIDTIGAGDCFIAGLISATLKQYDFHSALRYANSLAADKIQLKGMSIHE